MKRMKSPEEKREQYLELLFLAGIFIFTFCWAVIQPLATSPDEGMRMQISDYIVKHMRLPHGGDPEIRNEIWGISYGFNPILPNMTAAVFMKIAGIFTEKRTVIVMAGRMTNILCTTGTAYMVLRIGSLSFNRRGKWMFACFVMLLPETLFLGSYLNNDAMALFACAWMFYLWVKASKEGWTGRICIGLGCAVSICALTYYNAYGFILCSIFFFVTTMLLFREQKWDFKEMFRRGLLITAVFLVLAGWWFIRSYIIYDGDILGMKTSTEYSARYAAEEFKPWNRKTPQNMGMSIREMLFWVPENIPHNWMVTVFISFIGTFGHMSVYKPFWIDKVCFAVFLVGGAGILFHWKEVFLLRTYSVTRKKEKKDGITIITKTISRGTKRRVEPVMHLLLVLAGIIPVFLSVWYSYASDYQPQGRYIFSMALPFMYFVTMGYQKLIEDFTENERVRNAVSALPVIWMVFLAGYVYLRVFYPAYIVLW